MNKSDIKYINIPTETVQEALKSQESLDGLYLAFFIKCNYISSVYKRHRRTWVAQIATDIHRSVAVAKRIYNNALRSGFIVEKGKTLVARSFIKEYLRKKGIDPNESRGVTFKRLRMRRVAPTDTQYTDIVEKFREMLFISIVRDKKYSQLRPIYPLTKGQGGFSYADILTSTDERGLAKLSIRQIAPMLGMKKSSTETFIQRFVQRNKIFRHIPGLHYVGTVEDVCRTERLSYEQLCCKYLVFEKDGLVYENPSCLYSVIENASDIYSTGIIRVDGKGRRIKRKKTKKVLKKAS